MEYIHYDNVTKEILDSIKNGDLVRVNDWESPMTVKAVSDNFFVMTEKTKDGTLYSVCSKLPFQGVKYNNLIGGKYFCGTDDWIFGCPLVAEKEDIYEFEDEEYNSKYLQQFENGNANISVRTGVSINDLYVKAS